jgi:hypothetical protein
VKSGPSVSNYTLIQGAEFSKVFKIGHLVCGLLVHRDKKNFGDYYLVIKLLKKTLLRYCPFLILNVMTLQKYSRSRNSYQVCLFNTNLIVYCFKKCYGFLKSLSKGVAKKYWWGLLHITSYKPNRQQTKHTNGSSKEIDIHHAEVNIQIEKDLDHLNMGT